MKHTCGNMHDILTVCLPPAQIVPKVTVAGIQNYTAIKARRVQEGLFSEKLLPVKHIRGRQLGGHMGHELTAREAENKYVLTKVRNVKTGV